MKKRYLLWSAVLVIASVLIFSLLSNGCSKPKVIFENEYMRTYENNKDLNAWNPDWQEGEFWTVHYCHYYVPYDPRKKPFYQQSSNSKYLFAGKDVIKEGKTKLIHVNNIDIKVLFKTYYTSEIITYRISYVENYYNINSYNLIENGEIKSFMVGSKYPGAERFDLPVELPLFPINLEEKTDSKEFQIKSYKTEYTPELRKELDLLKEKRVILIKHYSDEEWVKIQSKYPEFKDVANNTVSKRQMFQVLLEERMETAARAKTIEIHNKIYQIVNKIDLRGLKSEIKEVNFSDDQIIKIFTKTEKSYKEQEIKVEDFVYNYIDNLYKTKGFLENNILFSVKVINENVENSKKDLDLYQIWSTKYNWPLLSFRVSNNRPYHISFLFINQK